jgi:RecA/RadA recombinase
MPPQIKKAAANATALLSPDLDSFYARMTKAAAATNGSPVVSAADASARIRGICMPSLALWYLFGSNVLPLSRIVQIVGPPGSCKTSLLFEIYRWFGLHNGMGGFIDNESKDSAKLRDSIIHDPEFRSKIDCKMTTCMEEWMNLLFAWMGEAIDYGDGTFTKEGKQKTKGYGWHWPLVYGNDSLMSTSPRATLNEVIENGEPKQKHPLHAKLLADFFRVMPTLLHHRPVLVGITNHLKMGTDKQGYPVRNIPGGYATRFMETTEIDMKMEKRLVWARQEGVRIRLKLEKNSNGPGGRVIYANMLWTSYADPATGVTRQDIRWDWSAATMEMLFAIELKNKGLWKEILEVVDLHKINNNAAWSRELGFAKDDAVTFSQLGRALEARADIVLALCPLLLIHHFGEYQPGIEYGQQLKDEPSKPRGIAHNIFVPDTAFDAAADLFSALDQLPEGEGVPEEEDVEVSDG